MSKEEGRRFSGDGHGPVSNLPAVNSASKWDCVLLTEDGTEIPANRRDLTLISPVLNKMLKGFFLESYKDTVLMRNIEGQNLKSIIECYYTRQASPSSTIYPLEGQ